jgi:hypothetical protein
MSEAAKIRWVKRRHLSASPQPSFPV